MVITLIQAFTEGDRVVVPCIFFFFFLLEIYKIKLSFINYLVTKVSFTWKRQEKCWILSFY